METNIKIYSVDSNDEFDNLEFYIDKNTAIISLKSIVKKDDTKCISIAVADLNKLAKIINDIKL